MELEKIFESIATKMKIDFSGISAEIEHRGSKGRVREIEVVNEFLKKYLPSMIGISCGEIVDTLGDVSSECDIILYDAEISPILLDKESYKIIPIECVYGILEIKSKLDKSELKDAFDKISRVKRLTKKAFYPQKDAVLKFTSLYDKEWDYYPTLGFVFAYDSIDLLTLKDYLDEMHRNMPLHERIDYVCVLNKGMIVNYDDKIDKLNHTPTSSTRLRAISSDNPLMLNTVFLQQLLQGAWMPKFRIMDYLKGKSFGNFIDK